MDFLSGLNPPQQEAVRHVEGPLLILAGAGSGKTKVVTHRISHLVQDHRVPPDAVLAVTFTNKAAGEMRERVAHLLNLPPNRGPLLSTFHSFCVRLLRRDGTPLAQVRPGFTKQFLIYDDDDQISVLKAIYRQNTYDDKALPPRQVLSVISQSKNKKESPEDLAKVARDDRSKKIALIFEQYNAALVRANAMDFDDLLLESVRLLQVDAYTRESWQHRLEFLMVDEYQDTNRTQYELMRLLCGPHHNVCAVGDEDQSIYSWRGADIRNILDFEHDFPNAKIVRLEQNYRSTKNILEAASAVISRNKERKGKWLWTDSGQGDLLTLYEAGDAENEALFIADTARQFLSRDPKSHVAVLYRTNSQSRPIEEAMRRYRLKYKVVGGLSFYQRAEIKDMLAYLKHLLVPGDSVSFMRIVNTPARGIGRTTTDELERYANQHSISLWEAAKDVVDHRLLNARAESALALFRHMMDELRTMAAEVSPEVLIRHILERTGYRKMLEEDKTPGAEGRLENLDELVNAAADAAERGEDLAAFLDHAALVSDADQVDAEAPVSMLTIHNAKGLEFPVVFLAGMEERLFPHSRSIDDPSAMEEERRLCYVGMTRARQRLYLTYAQARRKFGGGPLEPAMPSRFLREIPMELCDDIRLNDAGAGDDVDLFSERSFVRETVSRASYPGKTYNSEENIAEFFRQRGIPAKAPKAPVPVAQPAPKPQPTIAKKAREGSYILNPKFGRGQIVRREGEGDDAKLTVMFPGHGMKKLIQKYAGTRIDE